jgi:hypothetical protein
MSLPEMHTPSRTAGYWFARLAPPILLVALIVLLFYPIFMVGYDNTNWWSDYTLHRQFADEFEATQSVENLPHFAYHLTIIAVSHILPDMPDWQQGRLPVMGAYIGLGLLVYALLTYNRHIITHQPPWWVAIAAALIMLSITPILFVHAPLPLLLGYINPTTYHNPTQIMLKLWVIPVSLLAWRALYPRPLIPWKRSAATLLAAALIVGMTATKPNYTLVLIPGLVIIAGLRVLRRQPVDWLLLTVGLLGPSLIMLGAQYVIAFTNPDGSSIGFEFGKLFWFFAPSRLRLLLMLLGSIAFPAALTVLYFNKARRDTYLTLCWLLFLLGLAISYSLYEDGPRMEHGNFLWTSYITLFVLMFAALRFFINEALPRRMHVSALNWRLALVLLILGLHMVSAVHVWNGFVVNALSTQL